MHKKDRKLRLRRETLKDLSAESSGRVAGGNGHSNKCYSQCEEFACGGVTRYVNTKPQPCYQA